MYDILEEVGETDDELVFWEPVRQQKPIQIEHTNTTMDICLHQQNKPRAIMPFLFANVVP